MSKADAALIYRLKNKKLDISYTFRIAHTNTIYQRTKPFSGLDDYLTQQHGIAIKKQEHSQFKAYINSGEHREFL
jgi:hypothetical protein